MFYLVVIRWEFGSYRKWYDIFRPHHWHVPLTLSHGVPLFLPFCQHHRAMKRACLVRELQLLFLHVMGEARDVPLGPGMSDPPPLLENVSILAQVT